MTSPRDRALVLAVHPTSRGLGWVAFEGPFAPHDWAIVTARRDKNTVCARKIEQVIERLQPHTLILETFDGPKGGRPARIRRLCRTLLDIAGARGMEVALCSRAEVKACFSEAGAGTRHEIAAAVARHITAFGHKLPGDRKAWESEDPRMALFNAAALVLTHYRLEAEMLFDHLREAA